MISMKPTGTTCREMCQRMTPRRRKQTPQRREINGIIVSLFCFSSRLCRSQRRRATGQALPPTNCGIAPTPVAGGANFWSEACLRRGFGRQAGSEAPRRFGFGARAMPERGLHCNVPKIQSAVAAALLPPASARQAALHQARWSRRFHKMTRKLRSLLLVRFKPRTARMRNRSSIALLLLGSIFGATAAAAKGEAALVEVRQVWDRAPHNAFTDLVRFKGHWFCVFREGTAHVSPDGALRVITSPDGREWVSAALLTQTNADLRDAKITVTPNNELMLSRAGALHQPAPAKHQSLAWFSKDGRKWSDPVKIGDPNMWLWRVTWHPKGHHRHCL